MIDYRHTTQPSYVTKFDLIISYMTLKMRGIFFFCFLANFSVNFVLKILTRISFFFMHFSFCPILFLTMRGNEGNPFDGVKF